MIINIFNKMAKRIVVSLLTISASTAFLACSSNDVAGTDEQSNSIADKISSSSEGLNSSSSNQQGDIIHKPDSTFYIETRENTTKENLQENLEKIFGNDSLHPRIGSGDTLRLYTNLILTDSIGPLYFGMHDDYYKYLSCSRAFYDEGQEYVFDEYSTQHYGTSVKKRIRSSDASIIENFKTDCEAESGVYELMQRTSCEFQNCEFDNASCTVSNVEEIYVDPTWEKYSSMLIDLCRGPSLDSIEKRNLPEVLSGYTLYTYSDSIEGRHSQTLFEKNHLTFSYQVYNQFASCSDNDSEILLTYEIYLQEQLSPAYVDKSIQNGSSDFLQEFKEDCQKEGGNYFVDIFPTCRVHLEAEETADSTAQHQYTDPNWEKYAQKVIDRCKS